jgi:hypothetical protein
MSTKLRGERGMVVHLDQRPPSSVMLEHFLVCEFCTATNRERPVNVHRDVGHTGPASREELARSRLQEVLAGHWVSSRPVDD